MNPDLLTSGLVAAVAKVDQSTVHRWATSGRLPVAFTVNGIRFFDRSAVETFLATRDAAKAEK